MARGKKKEELTLEEKLERALVPVEEQPYEVPGNWCWTYLKDIAQWGSGGTPSRKNPAYYDGNIPWVKTGELEDDYLYDTEEKVSVEAIQKSNAKLFPVETVLIAMYGATIGKTAILGVDAATNQACACAICNSSINNKYLFYYLRSQKDNFIEQGKGGAQPNISQNIIKNNCIPLPSKAEQKRIVEKIESLFVKLNESKEKLQNILDTFEDRKAVILYKAFQGTLTRTWRENYTVKSAANYLQDILDKGECSSRKEFKFWNNDSLPESWAESKIGNLLYFAGRIGWKGLKAEEYTEEGPLLLSVYNLNDGDEVSYNRVYHISDKRYEESPEIMVKQGDVLLTKDGAGIGKLGYVKELAQKATINYSLLLIRPGNVAISKYIFYLLSGPELQRIVKERITGSATPHLFQKDIKEFIIPVPPLEEQREIVRILDDILSKETNIYKTIKKVVAQTDLMKKSILAKAFRGELGTNNPEEESPIELLKIMFTET